MAAPKVAKLVKETDEDWERLRNPTRAERRAERVPQQPQKSTMLEPYAEATIINVQFSD
ncbi:hypothetical protein [Burkholderia ambifaria]|uniref:hypothetical protein n=1 Tax=Burkholderia ambifaria TaxID=152480 RepID=UPI00158D7403|nr:hypothetical protein [Burkholderia ambifaria]